MKEGKRYIESIAAVMSSDDALHGIHIDMIAQRLIIECADLTFGKSFEELKDIANRLILSDCRRGSGTFEKVRDTKTGRARRGMYKLKQ